MPELLGGIEGVAGIEAYCGRFLVAVHSANDDQDKELQRRYAKIQMLLTTLEGRAMEMMRKPDAVVDASQGELLAQLVDLARNIALLASSGTFASSSSAWVVTRTFVEAASSSWMISNGEDAAERTGRAIRFREQREADAMRTVQLGEIIANWASDTELLSDLDLDIRSGTADERNQILRDVAEANDRHLDSLAFVEDTGVDVGTVDYQTRFRRIDMNGSQEYKISEKLPEQGKVRIVPARARNGSRGELVDEGKRVFVEKNISFNEAAENLGLSREFIFLLNHVSHAGDVSAASTIKTEAPSFLIPLVLVVLKVVFDRSSQNPEPWRSNVHACLEAQAMDLDIPLTDGTTSQAPLGRPPC